MMLSLVLQVIMLMGARFVHSFRVGRIRTTPLSFSRHSLASREQRCDKLTGVGNYWLSIPAGLLLSPREEGENRHRSVTNLLNKTFTCSLEDKEGIVGSIDVHIDSQFATEVSMRNLPSENPSLNREKMTRLLESVLHYQRANIWRSNHADETKPNSFQPRNDYVEYVDWITTDGHVLCPLPRSVIHEHNLLHRGIGVLLLDRTNHHIFVHERASTKRLFPSMLDTFIGGVSSSGESSLQTLLREVREEAGIDLLQSSPSLPELKYIDEHNARKGIQQQLRRLDKQIQQLRGKVAELSALVPSVDPDLLHQLTIKLRDMEESKLSMISVQNAVQSTDHSMDEGRERLTVQCLGSTIIRTDYNHCLVDVFLVSLPPSQVKKVAFLDGEIAWGRWMSLEELRELLVQREKDFVPDGMQVWNALPGLQQSQSCSVMNKAIDGFDQSSLQHTDCTVGESSVF